MATGSNGKTIIVTSGSPYEPLDTVITTDLSLIETSPCFTKIIDHYRPNEEPQDHEQICDTQEEITKPIADLIFQRYA